MRTTTALAVLPFIGEAAALLAASAELLTMERA